MLRHACQEIAYQQLQQLPWRKTPYTGGTQTQTEAILDCRVIVREQFYHTSVNHHTHLIIENHAHFVIQLRVVNPQHVIGIDRVSLRQHSGWYGNRDGQQGVSRKINGRNDAGTVSLAVSGEIKLLVWSCNVGLDELDD